MNRSTPIACTLTAAGLAARTAAWAELWASGLVTRARVPGGIRLTAAPGAAKALMDLVDLERECCAWIRFEVVGERDVIMTAGEDGEAVLATMFQ